MQVDYRRIYRKHHGTIPVDDNGRTYEIHHMDNNHNNNDPANLKAVSIQEHYDIHYAQGDWGAAALIATKMKRSPAEISALVSLQQKQLVDSGTHNFLGGAIQRETNDRRVKDGTHNLLGGAYNKARVADGTHPFLSGDISRKTNARRLRDGTHNLVGDNSPSRKSMAAGTHHFLIKAECPHCGKVGQKAGMTPHHFDKCKALNRALESPL